MAVFALVSAKGSPGVTTTLVALTRTWQRATGRRALGLDLDPSGGDVAAGVLLGSPRPGAGLLALATQRQDNPLEAVLAAAVPLDTGGALIVPGVPDVARAGAIALAWDVVVAALPELDASDTDVLIDGGRLVGATWAPVWMAEVDHAVVLVRPSLPSVVAAHRLASTWPAATPLGTVVVDAPSPYSPGEAARAVDRALMEVLPFDPGAAAVHSEGARPGRTQRRGPYARAVDRLALALGGAGPTLSGAGVVHAAALGPVRAGIGRRGVSS